MVQDAFETETLARLYLNQGHPEKALPILQRLHQEDPSNASISQSLAQCDKLLERRLGVGLTNHDKRLVILQRMLAMLAGTIPVKLRRRLDAAQTVLPSPTLSPRERRLAVLQKLMKRLTAREA